MEEVRAMASLLAGGPTVAYGMAKRALARSFDLSLAEALECEADFQDQVGRTEDASEGIRAFIEKRLPSFRGR
jgi:2-(1,2-epoxy-1,2-dihydrophenyl)acetyl-CoA isomerase